MQNVKIRRPIPSDKEGLNLFFREVIIDTFSREGLTELKEDIDAEIATKNKYVQLDLETDGAARYFLLAEAADGTLLGTIEYGPVSDLINSLTDGEYKELMEVGTVFIVPKYQRQGLGSLLLDKILQTLQIQGFKEFCLDSGYRNAQVIWRKKFGAPSYTFKDYWGKNNHHMIWKIYIEEILKA